MVSCTLDIKGILSFRMAMDVEQVLVETCSLTCPFDAVSCSGILKPYTF